MANLMTLRLASNIKLIGKSVTKLIILPSIVHPGNMTMRWRGISMRRMSMFPNSDPAHLAFTEDAIRNEMENGKSL